MPTVLRLRLIPQQDAALHLEHAPAQGWFLALADACDPDWAKELHPRDQNDRPDRRAYALSPLYRADDVPAHAEGDIGPRRALDTGHVRAGQPLTLRIGLPEDERAAWLCERLARLTRLPSLGTAPCRLDRAPRFASDDPDVVHRSWATLAQAQPASHRLGVLFATPTFFAAQGDMILLPDPDRLLWGWRRAWERFGPFLPEGAAAFSPENCASGLRIARYELKTDRLPIKGGLRIGFSGWMEMEWRANVPDAARRAALALAGIADFLGTGAKTTMGMGQTRIYTAENS